MKISYITTYDAQDVHNWSGLGYYISKALAFQNNEIEYIGNLHQELNLITKVKDHWYKRMKKGFDLDREPYVAKKYAEQVKRRVSANSDIIFSPSSIPIALLKSDKPKVFYTDATFAGMMDFYGSFTGLSKETIKKANILEHEALSSCSLAIYSSEWAAKSAIEFYGADPTKIKVVPFGANIDCDRNFQQIKEVLNSRDKAQCQLLFIGVDWERKGGNLALEVAKQLNKLGLPTRIHIAGLENLPFPDVPAYVTNHGYISKTTQEGREKLNALFEQCHFLILPTIAEAYGLVFCEANSWGMPCLSYEVGGVGTIIKSGKNGVAFPLTKNYVEFCDFILSNFRDQHKYFELCCNSFREFEERLNWNVAGKQIKKLLEMLH